MIYLQLFLSFLQIGALSFGGGYAAMPLIEAQIVWAHGWLDLTEFANLVTIAEMTPGPIAVNSATFVGYETAGFWGAFFATLGVMLPSFVIISASACVLRQFESLQAVRYAFFGIRAGVLALIIKALVSMYRQCPKNLLSCVLMAASFAAAVFFKVNVLLIIACCAAAGLVSTLAEGRRRS